MAPWSEATEAQRNKVSDITQLASVWAKFIQGLPCSNVAEAEAPILWPRDVKSQLVGKDPDAGKDWGQEKKGATGWDGWMASLTQWTWIRESLRDSEGQRSLVGYSPWSHKVRHDLATEQQQVNKY